MWCDKWPHNVTLGGVKSVSSLWLLRVYSFFKTNISARTGAFWLKVSFCDLYLNTKADILLKKVKK